jgi:hypothetical protein
MAMADAYYPERGVSWQGNAIAHHGSTAILHLTMTGKGPSIDVDSSLARLLAFGIFGLVETKGELLDTAWAGCGPLFTGVCLILLFGRGLFCPWWLFRKG